MRIIRIRIKEEHYERFKEIAEAKSLSIPATILVLADRELERVESGRRERSPGRPPGDARIRELGGQIGAIYKRLREGQWAENSAGFEELFSAQLAEFGILMETKNLEGLEDFYSRRPWVTEA